MLKKRILIFISLAGLFGATVYADSGQVKYKDFPTVQVEVNGQKVESEVPGINMEGTTLVPLRAISESLGAAVSWNGQTSTVTIVSAQNPASAPKEEQVTDKKAALNNDIHQLYVKLEQFGQEISRTSESLRIAQDMAESNNMTLLSNVKELYIKHLADKQMNLNESVTNLQKEAAKQQIDITDMLRTISKYNETIFSYRTAVDMLQQYYSSGKKGTLDTFNIMNSSAYDVALRESMTCYKKQLEFPAINP